MMYVNLFLTDVWAFQHPLCVCGTCLKACSNLWPRVYWHINSFRQCFKHTRSVDKDTHLNCYVFQTCTKKYSRTFILVLFQLLLRSNQHFRKKDKLSQHNNDETPWCNKYLIGRIIPTSLNSLWITQIFIGWRNLHTCK